MTGELVRLVIFVLVMIGAVYGCYRFDRDVMEPAITRASARVLGISEAEYRQARWDFFCTPWRWLRKRVRR